MEVNIFEKQYKHLINIPVKQYNSRGYSKKYGNISVHEKEFNPNTFNYIVIDNNVFHINYKEDVVLDKSVTKKDKKGKEIVKNYGIISGSCLVEITPDYLLNGFIDEYTPVSEYIDYLHNKFLNGEGITDEEIDKACFKPLDKEFSGIIVNDFSQLLNENTEKSSGVFSDLTKKEQQNWIKVCDEYKTNTNSVGYKLEKNFNQLVELYKKKNSEYATDSWDSNFIKGANILGISKEEVLLGYATKHIVSIIDIIKGKPASLDVIREKIGDIQVYMGLLQIMFEEKLEK